MARLTSHGVAAAVALFVALSAALTAMGIEAEEVDFFRTWWLDVTWDQIVVLTASSIASVCGIAALCIQFFSKSRQAPQIVVVLSAVGLVAHLTMLVCWTVKATNYDIYSIELGTYVTVNWFDYFSVWGGKQQAFFIFGLAIGAASWIVAVVFALLDLKAAKRSQAADTIPIDGMYGKV